MRASDLHLHSGAPVSVRVDGQLRPLEPVVPLKADRIAAALRELMGEARWEQLLTTGECDFVCKLDDGGRCRTAVIQQQRGVDAVFRLIPPQTPSLAELGLPPSLAKLTQYRTGLVLCTGPLGCGKSTTLAALLGSIIDGRRDHVLTLESPIEVLYPRGKSRVNQRQIGRDSESYAAALRGALREDPDIIAVAELQTRETISLAMTAAETGHLVLGTLHTEGAVATIGRVVNAFAADEQGQARSLLAESLRAVVSQRLLPRADGPGRVAAVELMIVTPAIANLIRDNKTHQIPSAMTIGRSQGMQLMGDSVQALLDRGLISPSTAREATQTGAFEA